MAKRCIFFQRDNMLYKRTVEVTWDKDCMTYNKSVCSDEIYSYVTPDITPCIDVSSNSRIYRDGSLSPWYTKNEEGIPAMKLFDALDERKDIIFPKGCKELLYYKCLTENQVMYILTVGSFYDIYTNPDKDMFSAPKALAVLQLLYNQGKIDYLSNINMFLHWYYFNGEATEWNIK